MPPQLAQSEDSESNLRAAVDIDGGRHHAKCGVGQERERTHRVTDTMLGSTDGGVYGVYDLTLGALKKGTHTIQFTVGDDGKGNEGYSWDALTLFAE